MTDFVNYRQVLTDLQSAIVTANVGFAMVGINLNMRDYNTSNMPLADIRFKRATPQAGAGGTYYVHMLIEVEIATFALASLDDAAKIREELTNSLQRVFQVNPRFGSSIDTTILGNIEFATGENNKEGFFAASAVLDLNVFLYTDR